MVTRFKLRLVNSFPGSPVVNSMYVIDLGGGEAEIKFVDHSGTVRTVSGGLDQTEVQALIDAALAGISAFEIVDDIPARDALTPSANTLVLVVDASGDGTVNSGSATYAYDHAQTTWIKLAEYESMDVVVNWINIAGKPSTFPPDSHTHSIAEVMGLQSALDAKIDDSEKGAANGVATLDGSGQVPSGQLPPISSSPTTTAGDMIVRGATEDERLPVGNEGDQLMIVGGVPAYQPKSTVPYICLTHSAVINLQIAQGSTEVLPWDTQEHIDTPDFSHDVATNNSRITVNADGRYNIQFNKFAVSSGSNRLSWEARVRVNGTAINLGRNKTYSRGVNLGSGISATMNIELALSAGDYVEATIYVQDAEQTSAVNSVPDSGFFMIRKIDQLGGTKGEPGQPGSPGGAPATDDIVGTDVDMGNFLTNRYNFTAGSEYTGSEIDLINKAEHGQAVVRWNSAGYGAFIPVNGSTEISGAVFDNVTAHYYDCYIEVVNAALDVEHKWIKVKPVV